MSITLLVQVQSTVYMVAYSGPTQSGRVLRTCCSQPRIPIEHIQSHKKSHRLFYKNHNILLTADISRKKDIHHIYLPRSIKGGETK